MRSNSEEAMFLHPRTALILGIVLSAAVLRVVPHPLNFTPIGALALFSGAYFSSKRAAFGVPLLSLIAGDTFVAFHRLIPYVYASFAISILIGFWLRRKRTVSRVGIAVLAGAIQFYLVTNFAVWFAGIGSYPKTASGLAACYLAGIPPFWNSLASDAFYATVLFGGIAFAERRFPSLRSSAIEML